MGQQSSVLMRKDLHHHHHPSNLSNLTSPMEETFQKISDCSSTNRVKLMKATLFEDHEDMEVNDEISGGNGNAAGESELSKFSHNYGCHFSRILISREKREILSHLIFLDVEETKTDFLPNVNANTFVMLGLTNTDKKNIGKKHALRELS